jgi:hypothetical protein
MGSSNDGGWQVASPRFLEHAHDSDRHIPCAYISRGCCSAMADPSSLSVPRLLCPAHLRRRLWFAGAAMACDRVAHL